MFDKIEINKIRLKKIANKMKNLKISTYEEDELIFYYKKKIIQNMKEGSFQKILPIETIEDIYSFSKENLSEGIENIIIGIITEDQGMMFFLYEVYLNNNGIVFSQAKDFYIPKRSTDKTIPSKFSGYPIIAIDISSNS